MKIVSSSCIYCGVGCQLNYQVEKEKIVKVFGNPADSVSQGRPCAKGLTISEVWNKNRVLCPQIKTQTGFKKVSWQQALRFIAEKTKDLAPQEIFFSGSGRITNEDNFVIQKFARKVFQTNNIDGCCARLCHQPTVQAMTDCFGTPNLTRIENLSKIDTLLVIGSNPASNYPVFWNKVLQEKQKRKLKVILVGTMFSLTAKTLAEDDLILVIQQGTEQVFLNGLVNFLLEKGDFPQAQKIEGFERLKAVVSKFRPDFVVNTCKISPQDFQRTGETIFSSLGLGVFHGMGLTQHVNGIENIHSLLNLVILKKAFLLTLRGEINVQGVGDMKCVPLPFGDGPLEKGKNMIEAFYLAPVKAAFISSFNPARSLPDLRRLWENLSKMFLVLITPHFSKTAEFASVILPSPILIERRGTITNGERRVRLVRQVIPTLGEARPEWWIYKHLAKILGKGKDFNYQNEEEIFQEIVKTIPDYQNLSPEEIFAGRDVWPEKKEKFVRFFPEDWEGLDDPRSEKYPFLLTTFRQQNLFLTSEEIENAESLKKLGNFSGFYLSPKDAQKMGIKDGQKIKVESVVGDLVGPVKIEGAIPQGIVAASFHDQEFLVDTLFPLEFDEETFTPNFKATAVRLVSL